MLYIQWTKNPNLRSKVLLILLFPLFSIQSFAQKKELYLSDHDFKQYYFGITLGFNKAGFQTHLHPSFLQQDSILVAQSLNAGGFALGLLATTRLSNRFEFRFNPQLMFTERSLFFKTKYPDLDNSTETIKKVESVITTFPLQLKFRSDRIGNFRVYMLGGVKFDFDLAANAKARKADDMIRLQKMDYGIEAGMGFNFYFPSFILSPEIKISNGLGNMHGRNESLNFSRVLDGVKSRMIMFSIHLEG
jgi:hypothetical protein